MMVHGAGPTHTMPSMLYKKIPVWGFVCLRAWKRERVVGTLDPRGSCIGKEWQKCVTK